MVGDVEEHLWFRLSVKKAVKHLSEETKVITDIFLVHLGTNYTLLGESFLASLGAEEYDLRRMGTLFLLFFLVKKDFE